MVSLREGHYTDKLNEYGREGWELVSVESDAHGVPAPDSGSTIPVPRAFGRLEDTASKLSKLGGSPETKTPARATTLLWVLRRPLNEE